jgi:hypothetical protein
MECVIPFAMEGITGQIHPGKRVVGDLDAFPVFIVIDETLGLPVRGDIETAIHVRAANMGGYFTNS